MSAFILALLVLSGQADCPPAAVAELGRARLRAAELDLAGAASQLQGLAANGCIDTEIAATYLRGLIDASAAFRYGGSPASLLSVRDAIASLAAVANGRPGPAEIARLGLLEPLDSQQVTVIEWADRAKDILPKDRLEIHLSHAGSEQRTIKIVAKGKRLWRGIPD